MTGEMQDVLLAGMRRQIRNDNAPAAQAIVRYVLNERPMVRALSRALRATDKTSIPDWFAAANGVRCFARMRTTGEAGGVLACARRDNERRAVEWLQSRVPSIPWANVEFDLRGAGAALPLSHDRRKYLQRVREVSRMLRHRHGQLAALRAIELLFYYDRLGRLLDETRSRVAVMSTYTNPWGIALNLAARQRGIPVVHVMHGSPLTPLPALDYDVAIVNDAASAETLRHSGCVIQRAIVKGAPAPRPMPRSLPPEGFHVALCLSKEPVAAEVTAWIDLLCSTRFVRGVIIRPHPLNLWRGLPETVRKYRGDGASLSQASLAEDLGRCFLTVAGNSSVHLEALSAGVPSIHAPSLDHTPPQALAFLGSDVVYRACRPQLRIAEIMDYYCSSAWRSRFASYVNVERNEAEADSEVQDVIMDLMRRVDR